jgi:parallel beta-helix repeat protein
MTLSRRILRNRPLVQSRRKENRRLAFDALEAKRLLTNYIVKKSIDVGSPQDVDSLSWAIAMANENPGHDTITFELADGLIEATGQFPVVTDAVTIGPESTIDPPPKIKIEYKGTGRVDGFVLSEDTSYQKSSTGSTLQNLTIEGYKTGIDVRTGSSTIQSVDFLIPTLDVKERGVGINLSGDSDGVTLWGNDFAHSDAFTSVRGFGIVMDSGNHFVFENNFSGLEHGIIVKIGKQTIYDNTYDYNNVGILVNNGFGTMIWNESMSIGQNQTGIQLNYLNDAIEAIGVTVGPGNRFDGNSTIGSIGVLTGWGDHYVIDNSPIIGNDPSPAGFYNLAFGIGVSFSTASGSLSGTQTISGNTYENNRFGIHGQAGEGHQISNERMTIGDFQFGVYLTSSSATISVNDVVVGPDNHFSGTGSGTGVQVTTGDHEIYGNTFTQTEIGLKINAGNQEFYGNEFSHLSIAIWLESSNPYVIDKNSTNLNTFDDNGTVYVLSGGEHQIADQTFFLNEGQTGVVVLGDTKSAKVGPNNKFLGIGSQAGTGVVIQTNGAPEVFNNIFRDLAIGVELLVGTPSIRENEFNDNGVGIDVVGGALSIYENTLNNNGLGIQLLSFEPNLIVRPNQFSNNGTGILVVAGIVHVISNQTINVGVGQIGVQLALEGTDPTLQSVTIGPDNKIYGVADTPGQDPGNDGIVVFIGANHVIRNNVIGGLSNGIRVVGDSVTNLLIESNTIDHYVDPDQKLFPLRTGVKIDGLNQGSIEARANTINHASQFGIIIGEDSAANGTILLSGNEVYDNRVGVRVMPESSGVTISGNYIDGNQVEGVVVGNYDPANLTAIQNAVRPEQGWSTSSVDLIGNYIGSIRKDQTAGIGNGLDGVIISQTENVLVSGNFISQNGYAADPSVGQFTSGLTVINPGDNTSIVRNEVGAMQGGALRGNAFFGIRIQNGPTMENLSNLSIDDNTVSGNGGRGYDPTNFAMRQYLTAGIYVQGQSSYQATQSATQGVGWSISNNRVGVNEIGTAKLVDPVTQRNQMDGILIQDAAWNSITDNVVSGNEINGIELLTTWDQTQSNRTTPAYGANWNEISGNIVGLDATGSYKIPNCFDGIFVQNGAFNAISGNVIAGNGEIGIQLYGTWAQGNSVEGNTLNVGNIYNGTVPSRGIYVNTFNQFTNGSLFFVPTNFEFNQVQGGVPEPYPSPTNAPFKNPNDDDRLSPCETMPTPVVAVRVGRPKKTAEQPRAKIVRKAPVKPAARPFANRPFAKVAQAPAVRRR